MAGGVLVGGAGCMRILGAGWNHEVHEQRGRSRRTRVVHAECHAVADCIRRLGEEEAFERLRGATAWIVELRDETAYDDAPPCRKCACLLRAFGVAGARHSTCDGRLATQRLPPPKPELLRVEMACKPLAYALDAMGVRAERLEAALSARGERDSLGTPRHHQHEPKVNDE
jgi:hypothetical protein